MNKTLKTILIILNVAIGLFTAHWCYKDGGHEPYVALFGQVTMLLSLLFEKQASNIVTKGSKNKATVDVDVDKTVNVHTEDTDDSTVKIRTH